MLPFLPDLSLRRAINKNHFGEHQWVAYVGDFALLRDFLARKKNNSFWVILKLFDALLRGYGQVVFANNPISGLLIGSALTAATPGMMFLATCTGILGLLLSALIGEPPSNLENGLTVYNPILIGAITHAFVPRFYDSFDGRLLTLILLSTVFSVYITRALGNGKLPCLTAPFNIVQLVLLFTLASQRNSNGTAVISPGNLTVVNATSDSAISDGSLIVENATVVDLVWGMLFRGVVTSSSQVFAIDDVAAASVIYLGILIYSPTMAGFSFAGALIGSLTGLGLGASQEAIYSGLWGYNSFLTGAALGGTFLVLRGQTTVAALFAIIFTSVLRSVLDPIFDKIELPVLTVPFVLTTWLFLGLRDSPGNTFPRPEISSFPEKQRYNFLEARRDNSSNQSEDSSVPGISIGEGKKASLTSHEVSTRLA